MKLNWPNSITRQSLLSEIFSKMCFIFRTEACDYLMEFRIFKIPKLPSHKFSIYKDKNNKKFKNKSVKAFPNMHLQYYIDIHKL